MTGRFSKDLHLSSFIGFAPAENPQAVVLVVVDEPQEKVFGGLVAAPAFRTIMETILRERGIFPQETEAMRKKSLAQRKNRQGFQEKREGIRDLKSRQRDVSEVKCQIYRE